MNMPVKYQFFQNPKNRNLTEAELAAFARELDQIKQEYLKICGCDKIQGYLISRPLDEEKAIGLLKK